MIRFITGKPGGGKGIVTCQQVIEELSKGERPVIAYFAFRFDPWVRSWKKRGKTFMKPEIGMSAYLHREYQTDFDLRKRVHVLDDDQAAEFFLYRIVDGKLVKAECDRDSKGVIQDFDHELGKTAGGCLYVIDEAWKFYGARNWGKTSAAFLSYVPLNRHFGDDVLIVTQHTKQIDVTCQRVAQDFWLTTNHSKLKVGMFRQPDVFSVAVYDQAPTGASIQPMERKVFRLDKAGLGSCYDTAGGLKGAAAGSVGSAGDMFARKTGLPWWAMILVLIGIGFGALKLTHLGGWLVGRKITNTLPHSEAVKVPGYQSVFEKAEPVLQSAGSSILSQDTNQVVCTGYVYQNGCWQVFFSDGTDARSDWGEVQKVTRRSVIVHGKEFAVAHPLNSQVFSEYLFQSQFSSAPTNLHFLSASSVQVIPFIDSRDSLYPRRQSSGFGTFQQRMQNGPTQASQSVVVPPQN
ncbi:MAG TPA: zonular occludens toxin domain-containing protein [Verrucomicrobiae bacterium]